VPLDLWFLWHYMNYLFYLLEECLGSLTVIIIAVHTESTVLQTVFLPESIPKILITAVWINVCAKYDVDHNPVLCHVVMCFEKCC